MSIITSTDTKRFYWIKLRTDFFSRAEIDFLLSQTNGFQYIVLFLLLCVNTANTDGELKIQMNELIVPYDIDKIVSDPGNGQDHSSLGKTLQNIGRENGKEACDIGDHRQNGDIDDIDAVADEKTGVEGAAGKAADDGLGDDGRQQCGPGFARIVAEIEHRIPG